MYTTDATERDAGARGDAGCIFSPFHPLLDILPVPCDLAAYPSEHVCRRLSCLPHKLSGKNLLYRRRRYLEENNPPRVYMVGAALIAHSAFSRPLVALRIIPKSVSHSSREKLFPPSKLIIKAAGR